MRRDNRNEREKLTMMRFRLFPTPHVSRKIVTFQLWLNRVKSIKGWTWAKTASSKRRICHDVAGKARMINHNNPCSINAADWISWSSVLPGYSILQVQFSFLFNFRSLHRFFAVEQIECPWEMCSNPISFLKEWKTCSLGRREEKIENVIETIVSGHIVRSISSACCVLVV